MTDDCASGRLSLRVTTDKSVNIFPNRRYATPARRRPIRAVFRSVWKRVTAMVEPAACVGGGDAVEGGGEDGFERLLGARLGGPQEALELGPAGLDRRQ